MFWKQGGRPHSCLGRLRSLATCSCSKSMVRSQNREQIRYLRGLLPAPTSALSLYHTHMHTRCPEGLCDFSRTPLGCAYVLHAHTLKSSGRDSDRMCGRGTSFFHRNYSLFLAPPPVWGASHLVGRVSKWFPPPSFTKTPNQGLWHQFLHFRPWPSWPCLSHLHSHVLPSGSCGQ